MEKNVEQVLGNVATAHQGIQLQESRAALDGMETSENGVKQILVIGVLFELNQLLGQQIQYLARLDQKILENFLICFKRHA